MPTFRDCLAEMPLIAILRGLTPDRAGGVGRALVDEGFRIMEVPLNRPKALDSISALAERVGQEAIVGAGTVLDPDDVREVANAGGRLIVAPNGNPAVVRAAKEWSLAVVPGAFTPSEALAMAALEVDGLKLFPAEMIRPEGVRALRSVLPDDLPLLPVGGIDPYALEPYLKAGASGFGIGSALYRAGDGGAEVRPRAAAFRTALQDAFRGLYAMQDITDRKSA